MIKCRRNVVLCLRRAHNLSADVAQLAEQLFRKQQVRGSNPRVGSLQANSEFGPSSFLD